AVELGYLEVISGKCEELHEAEDREVEDNIIINLDLKMSKGRRSQLWCKRLICKRHKRQRAWNPVGVDRNAVALTGFGQDRLQDPVDHSVNEPKIMYIEQDPYRIGNRSPVGHVVN
ncbi:hypothetical protein ACLOJK_037462, partial [Asimina triloba]